MVGGPKLIHPLIPKEFFQIVLNFSFSPKNYIGLYPPQVLIQVYTLITVLLAQR